MPVYDLVGIGRGIAGDVLANALQRNWSQQCVEGYDDVREFSLGLSSIGKKKSYREVKHYERRRRWLG